MNTSTLLLGVLFSSIGFGYFLYGKKQKRTVPFACGLILIIFPYFIDQMALLLIIGSVISIVPYFVRW
ncbi:amino acid transport protein [Acinetobacter sp. ANC 4648]|uniref:amino acid transport protein n=1 Tax=Acinetobacter sp. ANC 4648 TaxID=1977875 RepID=UPI000A34501B|nr:amino acid transport protein [Acinetobacter sp. ANC 4648]OTG84071.1 amino acid transport protein [Acinetobacter sp. ANC 4648]